MTQATNIVALAQAVGADIKALVLKTGTMANLTTTDKTSLVAALNEVKGLITAAGAQIDDATASTTTVYSSSKIETVVTQAIADLIAGAPTAFDTLKEIADYISSDTTAMGALTTSINNRVRFDSAQSLTAPQQLQACENIGVGDPTTDYAATYAAAKA